MTNNTNTEIYKLIGEFRQEMSDIINKIETNINSRFDRMETSINNRFEKIECNYVRQDEFKTVKLIIFGIVGIVIFNFMTNLTNVFVRKDITYTPVQTSIAREIGSTINNLVK